MSSSQYPLEAAFFEACPTLFFDKVYEICDQIVNESTNALEDKLCDEVEEEEHTLVRKCVSKMQNKLQSTFDANIDKFEMYSVINIFHVPPSAYEGWCKRRREQEASGLVSGHSPAHFVEPDKVVKATRVTSEAAAALDDELGDARRRLRSAKRQQAKLQARLKELGAAKAVLRADADKAEAVFSGTSLEGPAAVGPAVSALVAKSAKLHDLIEGAKPLVQKAAGLAGAGNRPAGDSGRQSRADGDDEMGSNIAAPAVAAYHAAKRTFGQGPGEKSQGGVAELRKLTAKLGN
mmetsp:Transcript_48462/g.110049  ORF Transcript_48462/g.110049 Transcript_48462/m.110049 type:complete len:292 (-) Transcript_48462:283-1158(-)